jgi:Skp1 family, tetramerisation domain
MESGTIVKLRCITDEEKEYAISLEEGEISELIRNTTEDREDAEIEIDIPRVKSWCLGKVVEFLKHYKEEKMKDIPTPLRGSSFAEV